MQELDPHEGNTFKIGTVSRLTGVSAHTLRKWESRYKAVVPGRTERGQRLYSRDDVERLSLIGRLVDAGVAPRDAACLTLTELRDKLEHLEQAMTVVTREGTRALRVAVIGSTLAPMLGQSSGSTRSALDIRLCVNSVAELEDMRIEDGVDVLIFECDSVLRETRQTVDALLERLDAQTALVIYRFSSRGDLLLLQAPQLATLRSPTDLSTIEKVVEDLARPRIVSRAADAVPVNEARTLSDVPAPRLSRALISRIAQTVPRVRCECPHHLAEILLGLRAFEEYSEGCESRNPEDAALHNYLWRSAAQARALFEDAIEHVAAAEGISIEE